MPFISGDTSILIIAAKPAMKMMPVRKKASMKSGTKPPPDRRINKGERYPSHSILAENMSKITAATFKSSKQNGVTLSFHPTIDSSKE